MSLNDDFDFAPAKRAQDAYDGAIANHWNGNVLEAWTIQREAAALLMGCKILGDWATFERFFKTNTYPSILKDIIIVLWLLSVDDKSVLEVVKLGEDRAHEKLEEALKWAEKHNIRMGSKTFTDGVLVLAKIEAEKINSRFGTEGNETSDKKKGSNRPVKSSSLSARGKQAGTTKAMS